MGLTVDIYKNARWMREGSDFSLNGISSRDVKGLCLVNVDGPFDPSDDYPAVLLLEGNARKTAVVYPAEMVDDEYVKVGGWCMDGGAYVATDDSRFSRAVEKITGSHFYGAVPIHDRIE